MLNKEQHLAEGLSRTGKLWPMFTNASSHCGHHGSCRGPRGLVLPDAGHIPHCADLETLPLLVKTSGQGPLGLVTKVTGSKELIFTDVRQMVYH